VIYNVVPWNTIDVPTLLELADQEWIIAVKQSGGDIHKLADLLRAVRASGSGLRVLSAVDALMFPSYLMGAHGSIAAILAVLPQQNVTLWDACQAGDMVTAREIHEAMLPLWRVLEIPSDMTARVKAAINLQGRAVGNPRRPVLPVTSEVAADLRSALEISAAAQAPANVSS
jgi:4-hydroxy-tetrahydrodipicolinate synthase